MLADGFAKLPTVKHGTASSRGLSSSHHIRHGAGAGRSVLPKHHEGPEGEHAQQQQQQQEDKEKEPEYIEYTEEEWRDAWRRYFEVPGRAMSTYLEKHPNGKTLYCKMCDKAFDPTHAWSEQHMGNLKLYGHTDAWVVYEGDDWFTGGWELRRWPWARGAWGDDDDYDHAAHLQVRKEMPEAPWLMRRRRAGRSDEEMRARAQAMDVKQQAPDASVHTERPMRGSPPTEPAPHPPRSSTHSSPTSAQGSLPSSSSSSSYYSTYSYYYDATTDAFSSEQCSSSHVSFCMTPIAERGRQAGKNERGAADADHIIPRAARNTSTAAPRNNRPQGSSGMSGYPGCGSSSNTWSSRMWCRGDDARGDNDEGSNPVGGEAALPNPLDAPPPNPFEAAPAMLACAQDDDPVDEGDGDDDDDDDDAAPLPNPLDCPLPNPFEGTFGRRMLGPQPPCPPSSKTRKLPPPPPPPVSQPHITPKPNHCIPTGGTRCAFKITALCREFAIIQDVYVEHPGAQKHGSLYIGKVHGAVIKKLDLFIAKANATAIKKVNMNNNSSYNNSDYNNSDYNSSNYNNNNNNYNNSNNNYNNSNFTYNSNYNNGNNSKNYEDGKGDGNGGNGGDGTPIWILRYRKHIVAMAPVGPTSTKAPPTHGWMHGEEPAPFKVTITVPPLT